MAATQDIEDIYTKKVRHLTVRNIYHGNDPVTANNFIKEFTNILDKNIIETKQEWNKINTQLRKKYHISLSTVTMNYIYRKLVEEKKIDRNELFEQFNVGKLCRTNSGITQITVLTSPYPNGQSFSCEHDCYYCPKEPAHEGNGFVEQPRSYLFNEPAVLRANANKFDAALQMWDRMSTLSLCGLSIDKLEVMVLGGTWGSYPEDYREEFIRDLYYAANTFYHDADNRRERYPLHVEIGYNEIALVRVIGLTLETRPDHVTARELYLFRKYGCTRVQIGVQHTDKKILSKINRGCYLEDTVRAIKNLLDVGLKIDVHLMLDLPFATPEDDIKMIKTMLYDTRLQFDQAKLYPFASLDWTKTKEWEDKGMNLHYSQEELVDVLIETKTMIHPWIRLNRVIRDIPSNYILAGNDKPNLRQTLELEMKKRNLKCQCIRCREVKNNKEALDSIDQAIIFIRSYDASDGKEYFISFETPDTDYIYGFCRLRLSKNMGHVKDIKPRIHRQVKEDNCEETINLFPTINNTAMIRELHVYGNMNPVDKHIAKTQHRGFGKRLIKVAETIAKINNYDQIAVISGIGVRNYYRKLGYYYNNTYMVKSLNTNHIVSLNPILQFLGLAILVILLIFLLF